MTRKLVVILTALNLEYQAVRQRLDDPQVHLHDKGTRFEIGTIHGTTHRVALGLTSKGNHSAAVLAERAMHEFSPAAMLFVGVAGALWGDATPLGDVVVATHVYAYHGGTSEDDGLTARPRVWEADHRISQLAQHLARLDDWTATVPSGTRAPKIHFGAIAAGEIVQNSRISAEANWIRQHYNDALAIEMEAAGIAQAGHLNDSPVAIVRGISDRADGTKTSKDDSTWQPHAAANAAAFALRLAEELITEQEHTAMHDSNPATTGATVHNFASGQVGIQAAHVTGSVVIMGAGPTAMTPAGLVAELAALRGEVMRERSAGTLDNDTYSAAHAELDIASTALKENTPEGRTTFILALKRLRGLIADVAGLATKIAAMIAAAKGLS